MRMGNIYIDGIDNLTVEQLRYELKRGGRFVQFEYCVSFVVVSFKIPSCPHFIRADQNAVLVSLPYTLTTLLLGWWGIPFGPIYSVQTLATNFRGGKNITPDVMDHLMQHEGAADLPTEPSGA